MRNVEEALRDGDILVVIVVLPFLANLRASLITLLAIPLSLVTAVLVLEAFGATINTMTLGGMAIAIGDLVDDAIIDVENVIRRLRENARLPEDRRQNPLSVIYHASVEVRSSVVFASLIGFITLFGLATRNGIMMVSHIRHLQQHEGVASLPEAVYLGAMERLAPILTAGLALIPLALIPLALIPLALGGDKPGSEIQTPMALVILCGLTTSTALNMFVVPALYLRFGRPAPPTGGAEGQIVDLRGGAAIAGGHAI